jgi:hypothetical protein
VRVELEQGDGPVALGRRADEGQRHGVIAAQPHDAPAGGDDRRGGALDASWARRTSIGDAGASPASATWTSRNGDVPSGSLYGRSSSDASRMAAGPKREPARNVVAPSNGAPRTATSARPTWSEVGSRANVRIPAKRGTASAST